MTTWREQFEKEAKALGFNLTRGVKCACPAPWCEYKDESTGYFFAGWISRICYDKNLPELDYDSEVY